MTNSFDPMKMTSSKKEFDEYLGNNITPSGYQKINYINSLGSKYLGCQDINFPLTENSWLVPTYEEICPFCKKTTIWRTTGIIPDYIECTKCNGKFKPRM
jgi:hypothetical protein